MMPSITHLFRPKSSLKSGSNIRDLRISVGPQLMGNRPTQAHVARLQEQVSVAQDLLTQLDALVSALKDMADAPCDGPTSCEQPSSSVTLSVALHLHDMKRSTKALTRILRKHAPLLPQTPAETPDAAPGHSTSPISNLYPAPLRLPQRDPPASALQLAYPDVPSPFLHEAMSFLDHSLKAVTSCPTSSRPPRSRPKSLPPPPIRNEALAHTFAANSPHFSTEAKTRRLRSLQGSLRSLDHDRPLGVDELMNFLRQGNSMREL